MAQLDAHLSGDQEVVGLTPASSATFFCGDRLCKVSDKMAYANSADPDQTAPEGAV